MTRIYDSELVDMIIALERHISNKDEGYPPYDVHERRFRLLCRFVEGCDPREPELGRKLTPTELRRLMERVQ